MKTPPRCRNLPKSRRLAALFAAVLAAAFSATTLRAHWEAVTYSLRGGWNAIYLHGDGAHATIESHLAVLPQVLEVWRWNPNPQETQFESSPLIPSAGTSDWSVWKRDAATGNTLSALVGQTAYLVRCSGTAADSYSLPLTLKALPPRSTWVRNGANLLGFPTRLAGAYPFFTTYFATFPAAIAAQTRIYKYVGGELGANNPVPVFSTHTEVVDRQQAYWFEAPVVGTFYSPFELSPSNLDGLIFGRAGSIVSVRLRNRTAGAVTLTVAPVESAAAPEGQTQISGPVPLVRRVFDAGNNTTTETPLTGAFNVVIGPQSSVTLEFGVDRAQMTGAPGALYASLLRFTDSGNLVDITLPVSALVPTLAGLWVGEVVVSTVVSKAPGSPGATTARPAVLRTLMHVDDSGTARLLSQVFVGKLASTPNELGLCTRESRLLPSAKSSATRLVAAHMPLDAEISTGSGSVALGASLQRTIVVPFNDSTNPFVHAYHPDHDNKDARGQPLPNGVESSTITRECAFTFTAAPPAGMSSVGWGTTVLGGSYAETISGLHKQAITVGGTFLLRRVSEIGSITLN
jgi:hypothetical protein